MTKVTSASRTADAEFEVRMPWRVVSRQAVEIRDACDTLICQLPEGHGRPQAVRLAGLIVMAVNFVTQYAEGQQTRKGENRKLRTIQER